MERVTGLWTRVAALLLAVVLLAVVPAGCARTIRYTRFSALQAALPGTLRVYTTDRVIYDLVAYTVSDSVLEGSGTRLVGGERSPFSGRIPFREIVYLQSREGTRMRVTSLIGALAATAGWFGAAAQDHGLRVYPVGGSCPFLYVWNGDRFVLQGEAFGTSLGRGLEGTTTCVLPAAAARDGTIAVRITNERPETHYIDRVQLEAFATPPGCAAVADPAGRIWPVRSPRGPLDPPAGLEGRDGIFRDPPPEAAVFGAGYRDVLELRFARPPGASTASLVVDAINTDLAYWSFEQILKYLGDSSLFFLDRIESDPALIETLRAWILDLSLSVEVWSEGEWRCAGRIAPEASAIPFTKLVRIEVDPVGPEPVRVRLGTVAGGWRIDSVGLDGTVSAPLEPRPLRLRAAEIAGADVAGTVAHADGRRVVTLPGDRLNLDFDGVSGGDPALVSYALRVTGYLHEWFPAPSDAGSVLSLQRDGGTDRLAVVDRLVRTPRALLPILVEGWRRSSVSSR